MKLAMKHSRARSAFTIVEVLIATAVVGIFFVALYTGIGQCFGLLANAREDLRANQILLDKMEEFRLYNWDQVTSFGTSGSFVPSSFTEAYYPTGTNSASSTFSSGTNTSSVNANNFIYYGTVNVTNVGFTNAYATNLRLITVTLNWTNGTKTFEHSMSTLVSQYGIQRYIY